MPLTSPTVADLGALLHARTRNATGDELGTFTVDTRPTAVEAQSYIDSAVSEVTLRLPVDSLPDKYADFATRLIALRAGMAIELAYNPDRTEEGSAYSRLRELYEEGMTSLLAAADSGGADDTPFGFASVQICSPTVSARPDLLDYVELLDP